MSDKLKRLLAHVTTQEETPPEAGSPKSARRGKTRKPAKLDSEADDVSYDKLFDED